MRSRDGKGATGGIGVAVTPLTTILIGVGALLLGVLLGLPGRAGSRASRRGRWLVHRTGSRVGRHQEADLEELERELGKEWEQSRKATRHFTLINWMRKDQRGSHRRRSRRYFSTAAPRESKAQVRIKRRRR